MITINKDGTIEHDTAHRLAHIACAAQNLTLAIKLLKRAKSDLGVGHLSSMRTSNRIMNLGERLDVRHWYKAQLSTPNPSREVIAMGRIAVYVPSGIFSSEYFLSVEPVDEKGD